MIVVFIAIEEEQCYLQLELELTPVTSLSAAWLQRTGSMVLIYLHQGIQPLGERYSDTLSLLEKFSIAGFCTSGRNSVFYTYFCYVIVSRVTKRS